MMGAGRDQTGGRGSEGGGYTADKAQYLPGIVGYYSTPAGDMLSFPYNSSPPVLYTTRTFSRRPGWT